MFLCLYLLPLFFCYRFCSLSYLSCSYFGFVFRCRSLCVVSLLAYILFFRLAFFLSVLTICVNRAEAEFLQDVRTYTQTNPQASAVDWFTRFEHSTALQSWRLLLTNDLLIKQGDPLEWSLACSEFCSAIATVLPCSHCTHARLFNLMVFLVLVFIICLPYC